MKQNQHRSFFQWCRRYISFSLIAIVGAIIFMLFFTDTSVIEAYKYEKEIAAKEQAIKNEKDSLEYYRTLSRALDVDPVAMERVAREKFNMQSTGEDVFIFP